MRRVAASTIWDGLWVAAIGIRVAAVILLVVGPLTNEADELSGWDAERFQEIAERDGDGWVDQPIEYPPGSVIVFDVIARDDVVGTNRVLVLLSAVLEFALVATLWRTVGPRAAKAFLILGLPLVPMGLLRLDMLVTVVASLAAVSLLANDRNASAGSNGIAGAKRIKGDVLFALLVMAGTMIKIWPALVVVAAIAVGRRTAAAMAVAATGIAGVAWLLVVGAGLDPVDQVFSLRGATGWHVESLPGALTSLFGSGAQRLELNAFRIGSLNEAVVTAGRAVALLLIALLARLGIRPGSCREGDWESDGECDVGQRFALVMVGSVAALLITAPLLSPQFLLWLTPWVALLFASETREHERDIRPVLLLASASLVLTGAVLTIFGPAGLTSPPPALLLTIRNLALLALPFACLRLLRNGRLVSNEPR